MTTTLDEVFYFVVEGEGKFIVGEETQEASVGCTVWAAADPSTPRSIHGAAKVIMPRGISMAGAGKTSCRISRP